MLFQNTHSQVSCGTIEPATFTKTIHMQKWKSSISERVNMNDSVQDTNLITFIVSVRIFKLSTIIMFYYPTWKCLLLVRNTQQSLAACFFTTMNSITAPMSPVSKIPFHRVGLQVGALSKAVNIPQVSSSSCLVFWIWRSHSTAWLPRLLIKTESGSWYQ